MDNRVLQTILRFFKKFSYYLNGYSLDMDSASQVTEAGYASNVTVSVLCSPWFLSHELVGLAIIDVFRVIFRSSELFFNFRRNYNVNPIKTYICFFNFFQALTEITAVTLRTIQVFLMHAHHIALIPKALHLGMAASGLGIVSCLFSITMGMMRTLQARRDLKLKQFKMNRAKRLSFDEQQLMHTEREYQKALMNYRFAKVGLSISSVFLLASVCALASVATGFVPLLLAAYALSIGATIGYVIYTSIRIYHEHQYHKQNHQPDEVEMTVLEEHKEQMDQNEQEINNLDKPVINEKELNTYQQVSEKLGVPSDEVELDNLSEEEADSVSECDRDSSIVDLEKRTKLLCDKSHREPHERRSVPQRQSVPMKNEKDPWLEEFERATGVLCPSG